MAKQRRTIHAKSWRVMGYSAESFLSRGRYGSTAYRRFLALAGGRVDPSWPEVVRAQLERALRSDAEVWAEAVAFAREVLARYERERDESPAVFYGARS